MRTFFKKHQKALGSIGVALVMLGILVVGLLTYQDYSVTVDENAERTTSMLNYQYLAEVISGREITQINGKLEDYMDRFYGVAYQLPMCWIEDLNNFEMTNQEIYMMRHLMNFLYCFIGWVCFYFFLKIVFKNRAIALLGMLMACLYPRFWGEQFNNIKDLIFTSSVCECLLCGALCLKHEGKWRYEVLFAFTGALCTNTRFIGIMIPLCFFGYRLIRDLWLERGTDLRESADKPLGWRIFRYAMELVMLVGFYVLITPASWQNPVEFFGNVTNLFSNFSRWDGDIMFLGQMIPGDDLPWYYVPVWMAVSLPLWYVILLVAELIAGLVVLIRGIIRREFKPYLMGDRRWGLLCFLIAAAPIASMLFHKTTLYNGWRHMFYLTPLCIVLMLFALRGLWRGLCRLQLPKAPRLCPITRGICAALCVGLLGYQTAWIARWHPLEKIYFNPIGKTVAEGMDRDWWFESIYTQYQYIYTIADSEPITISCHHLGALPYMYRVSQEEKDKIIMVTEGKTDAEYIIETFEELPNVIIGDYYTCVHELKVDDVPISRVYVRNDVVERLDESLFDEDYYEYDDYDDGLEHTNMGYDFVDDWEDSWEDEWEDEMEDEMEEE